MTPLTRAMRRPAVLVAAFLFVLVGTGVGSGSSVDSAVMGASLAAAGRAPTGAARHGPYALIIVVDAGRFDEFNPSLMPNLARLVAMGTTYSQAWVGQLPSITETSHSTIGTGMLPYHHLILGETWRVPGTNHMAPNLLNGQLTRTGYIGHFIQQTHSPTLAGLVHGKYPGSLVVAVSGHKVYAADAMGSGAADFVAFGAKDNRGHFVPSAIPGHAPAQSILGSSQLDLPSYPRQPGLEDSWTTTLAEKFLFKYHPRVMMINLPEVDTFGHIAGTDGSVMQPLMSNVDKQIGRLVAAYGRAGMLEATDIVITTDHGMVPSGHTVLQADINAVITRAGGKPLYVGHGDYSEIWLNNISAVPRIGQALARANLPNVVAVFEKDAVGHYVLASGISRLADPVVSQAYGDLLASFDSAESPDIVLIYGENTITMTPLFLKVGRRGDHGGATWGSQHIPLVLEGPNIRQAYISQYPARLADIAPTVELLLGVTPRKQDGVPLADAMLRPPAWAVTQQNNVSLRLLDDVTALQREANNQPGFRKTG